MMFYPICRRHIAFTLVAITASFLSLGIAWGQSYDGPAELPLINVSTTVPTQTGKVTTVAKGGDLQSALNAANCGDTIVLTAGSVFSGSFTFPVKPCDAAHWIVVKSGGSLPAAGNRINPAYAGVLSLPGRPSFTGPGTQQMAKIITSNLSAPVKLDGANYYWLMGLEITRSVGTGFVGSLVSATGASNVVLDRDWIHGSAKDETAVAVGFVGANNVALINSYSNDLHCVAVTGTCVESHVVVGGLGSAASAGIKVYNNFLESGAGSVFFGGGKATATPTDITVQKNHFFKPMMWRQGQPGFVGGTNGNPFVVKNHFELKNAQRVLLEDNVLENVWPGGGQSGYSILLTPKNQSGKCPICQVTDVTVRFNEVKHTGGGFELGNGASDSGAVPLDGERFSVHDNEFDDIENALGSGIWAVIGDGPTAGIPPLKHVYIEHNTAYPSQMTLNLGGATPPNMSDFTFENNLIQEGAYDVGSQGGNGNCANNAVGAAAILKACWLSYTATSNGLVDGTGTWPAGNYFPTSMVAGEAIVGLDGKPLGVDQNALNQGISGVN